MSAQTPSSHTFTGINVTPLTDVMLVLLITFLLTANSFQENRADLPLPQVLDAQEVPSHMEVLRVDLREAHVHTEASLRELRESSQRETLALAIHRELPYSQLYPILEAAHEAGWGSLVLLTEVQDGG